MSALIEVTALNKSYGAHHVLKNVNFTVSDRESFAIIGPNGAGKTTLFKVLTGEVLTNSGSVKFHSEEVVMVPAFMRIRMGFGRTFQVARVFLETSVIENLIVAVETRLRNEGRPAGRWYSWKPTPDVVAEAHGRLVDMGLEDKRFVEARNLSHGDKKRLELAIALALNPRVLMLDEPTAGMSPPERHRTVELIKRIRAEQGITVMLTEHDMDVVFGLADRILVLNYGELIVVGSPEEVRRNPTVAEIYLGKEMVSA
jgi:branched-chain amino acid transport system ATP-binding protein